MNHKTQIMDGKSSFQLTKHSNAGIVRIRKKTARMTLFGVSSKSDLVTLIILDFVSLTESIDNRNTIINETNVNNTMGWAEPGYCITDFACFR